MMLEVSDFNDTCLETLSQPSLKAGMDLFLSFFEGFADLDKELSL
jgi:hypothetical protein